MSNNLLSLSTNFLFIVEELDASSFFEIRVSGTIDLRSHHAHFSLLNNIKQSQSGCFNSINLNHCWTLLE
ncbi:unnamed protein product [Amoebophrya sp. A120]|nr:unnamed protein product [Amoebophrya sp. A120]|eukprot:GSA120T00010523001.1